MTAGCGAGLSSAVAGASASTRGTPTPRRPSSPGFVGGAGSGRLLQRLIRAVGIFQDDQLVLIRVIPVLLIVRQLGQGDIVLLDDLLHELVVILGITTVLGLPEVQ